MNALIDTIRLFWAAARKLNDDHGFLLSAGVSFSVLLCLIPLVVLILAFIGTYLFTNQEVLEQVEHYVDRAMPALDPQITETISNIIRDSQIFGILGIVGLIWTSTWVFQSLRSALNIIMRVPESRSFLRGKALDILMVFVVLFFFLISMALSYLVGFIQNYRLPVNIDPILQWLLKYAAPFLFTFWMFFLIYKVIPNRHIRFATALKATLFGSLLWETVKHLFGWYVLHLGRFSVVYGSLSAVAVSFLWVYYSSVVLMLGGELAYLIEKARIHAEKT